MATAADVPSRYDLVLDGTGYLYANVDQFDSKFGVTPTFITRQNVSGEYGDATQDFWLSFSQRDWGLGSGQKFMRQNDAEKSRKFWASQPANISEEGKVTARKDIRTVTTAAAVSALVGTAYDNWVYYTTATNLYLVDSTGAVADLGAHGAGGAPDVMAIDASGYLYMNWSTGVLRLWDGAFSTFNGSGATYRAIAYLNNAIYAATESFLYQFDSTGVRTTVYQWKDGTGLSTLTASNIKLATFGGKLLILRGLGPTGAELWIYDGGGASLIAQFPKGFVATGMAVNSGVVFIIGYTNTGDAIFPQVHFYASGVTGLLWKPETSSAAAASYAIASWGDGVIWNDQSPSTSQVLFYSPSSGGVVSVATGPVAGAQFGVARSHFAFTTAGSTLTQYPGTAVRTATTLQSSQIDFDSSLTKLFRGIKVEFEAATDGDGGSVDIAYQIDGAGGSYTTVRLAAVSGTEYLLVGVTGKTLSYRITINKGTSTLGPSVKRVSLRAAPKQSAFRKQTYVIRCGGVDGKQPQKRWDGTMEPSDGLTLATALQATAQAGVPVTITDEFGTFVGIIENDSFSLNRYSPGEYVAQVSVREV